MFDITTLAATETSIVELVGGDDAPLYDDKGKRLTITVYGPGTKVYQRAQQRQQNQLMDKIKKRGKMDQSAEEKLAEQADFLAACTVSFNGFSYPPADGLEGQDLFRKAYADPSIGFIAAQVAAHINDWANFTKSSAES
ncbi:MAG: hypothetical protein RL268_1691 [Pseudomonadota bacterium]|jgi:hypothetical protein